MGNLRDMGKIFVVDLPTEIYLKLGVIASSRGVSMKSVILKALDKELNDDRDKKNIEALWGKK